MLKLKDGRKELYQWDVGVVADVAEENINEVHFSNLRYGVSFNIEVQNGTVTIPPEVLQSGADVFCWAFVRQENGGDTKKEQIFNVEKRPRPADYIYEPTDVLTWEALKKQIEEVEKGTIPTMDKVNVWELEAGAYYVNSIVFYATPHPPVYPNRVEMQSKKGLLYVHVDTSHNNSRDFYLFANGNIYFGHSVFFGFEAQGEISSVVADIRHEITNDNTDGFTTKKAVYNFGETIKTELLTDIGNKADKTEVETALSVKVDKSDILTEVALDEVYTDNQFYNANAVNSLITIFDEGFVTKDTFNTIIQEVANKFQTKVDKSNVLSNIDEYAQPEDIYNARVINEMFATKAYVDTVIGGIENGSY